jgi:hypothetical protein
VGYGDQFLLLAGPAWDGRRSWRLTTVDVHLEASTTARLVRLSSTAARGKGGICFGDSGGPNLVGSSHVTIAVNSYGTNRSCFGVAYATRIDRSEILGWIQGFLN